MRCLVHAALCAAVGAVAPLMLAGRADAEITISVNKDTQNMLVFVDGVEKYNWKVSTGVGGAPRAGTYTPQRLEKKWFSRKYGMSPMPSSIFFHEGIAIHGTHYVSNLGHRASHGCVRLLPANAATLFDMVRGEGMGATTIVISNTSHVAARTPPAVEKAEPVAAPPRETTAKAPVVEAEAAVVKAVEPPAPKVEMPAPAPVVEKTESTTDAVTEMSNE